MNITDKKTFPLTIELHATLLVALSAMLYGCLGFFGKKLIDLNFSISAMLFWRFFTAALWMVPFIVKNTDKKAFTDCKKYPLFKTFIFGGTCYGATSAFYFIASHYIGTGLAMVIFFTNPLFVVLLARVIDKHPISKPMGIALASIILGLLLLKGNQVASFNKLGICFAIIAALFYAGYVFSSKHIVRTIPSHYLTLSVCAGAALIFLMISLVNHEFTWPASFKAWSYIITFGVIVTAIPIQLLLEGLKHIQPGKVAVLSVLEPVVTLIIGITALHEAASAMQLTGAVIILLSAIVIQFE